MTDVIVVHDGATKVIATGTPGPRGAQGPTGPAGNVYRGVVADQAAMLAVPALHGDWVIRQDTRSSWVLDGTDPTVLGDWTGLPEPTAGVVSVNSRTGTVSGLAEASDLAAKANDTAVLHKTGDETATGTKSVEQVRAKRTPWADPRHPDWGAVGDGVAGDRGALNGAQGDSGNVRLPVGTYRVESNLTLSGSWKFAKGAVLKPDAGATITIECDIGAGRWQIFDLSAGGSVTWNSTTAKAERKVKVEWWGAVPGANPSAPQAAANRTAIQAAFNVPSSTRESSVVSFAGGAVYVPDRQLTITQQATKLDAKGTRLAFNVATWAGAITDSLLVIGSTGGNALASGEQDFSSGWTAEQACTVVRHDNGDGTFGLDLTATDIGEMDAITTAPIAVTAGLSYSASAELEAVTVSESLPDVGVTIVWLDGGGAEISRSSGTVVDCSVAPLTTPVTAQAVAPTGAVSANLELRVVGVATVGDVVRAVNPALGATSNAVPNFVDLDRLQILPDGSNPTTKIMHSLVRNISGTFLRWDWARLVSGFGADYCLYAGDYNPVEMNILELHTGSAILDGVHMDGSLATASPANASSIGKGKHQQHGRNAFWLKQTANLTIGPGIDVSLCGAGAVRAVSCGVLDLPNLYVEKCGVGDTRPITLLDTLGVPTLQLLSSGKANAPDFSVTTAAGTNPNTFKVQVSYRGTLKETFDNLDMNPVSAGYAITKLARSAYVVASDLHSASASPANQPAAVVAAQINTSTLPNTTKIVELVNCNAVDITGRINAANGPGTASTHNYAGLYMTGCKGVRAGGVIFKNALEWDVYADDACTDITIDDAVSSPLTSLAAPALKVRLPSSLETSRVTVTDTGMAGMAKRFDRPGTLTNWITQPARMANWTVIGGSSIVGTAVAPDGVGVVDVLRLPANTADATVGRSTATAAITGSAAAPMQVVVRFFARRNARSGYAFGEPTFRVQVTRTDGQRLLTARCPVGDRPHLFEFLLDTTQRLTWGLPVTSIGLPATDTTLTLKVANSIQTDQLDVEVWGAQIAPAGTPYAIDHEATAALSASAFGPVIRGPLIVLFRGGYLRYIWQPASPQALGLAPPLGDTQWRTTDIAWSTLPTAGISSPLGWRCTAAGNPGTWTAFGDPTAIAHPTVRTITGNDVLVLADDGQVIEANAAGAITLTVPPASSVAFPLNAEIEVYQQGAGQVTMTPGAGVTLRTPNGARTAQQYSTIGLRYRGSDIWVVSGDTTP